MKIKDKFPKHFKNNNGTKNGVNTISPHCI